MSQVPSHLFKSITFDFGKEFSNWKSISNAHDIDIVFADPDVLVNEVLTNILMAY
ncbi:Mobile element protein [Streptococcus oralis]|uniref:Mobile element protein n=1 Tax=Streptococcus oralis TaxID=1303 RepID=A0A139P6K0_STROR|nr:Mobile element protein [Streptococcus oralis]